MTKRVLIPHNLFGLSEQISQLFGIFENKTLIHENMRVASEILLYFELSKQGKLTD